MFFPLPRGPLRWNGLRLFKKIEAAKEQVKEPILVWILGPYMHDGLMSYTRRMLNGKPLKDGRTSYTEGPVQARTLLLSLSIRHILDWCVTKSIVYRGPIIWIQICLGYSRKQLRLERRPWMPAQCRTRKRRNQINQRQRQRPRPKAREGKPVIARPKANDLGQRCRQTMKKGRKKRRKKLMMKRKKLMRHPPKEEGQKAFQELYCQSPLVVQSSLESDEKQEVQRKVSDPCLGLHQWDHWCWEACRCTCINTYTAMDHVFWSILIS